MLPTRDSTVLEQVITGVVVVSIVGALVTLSVLGKDPSTLVAFASGPIVGVVVGAIAKGKLGAVAADVAVVKQQTDGQLQGPLTAILAGQDAAAQQHQADTEQATQERATLAQTLSQTAAVVRQAATGAEPPAASLPTQARQSSR